MIQAGLRSNFKNSCSMYVFHRGFQTLKNNKSNRAMASCLNHQFSRVSKPWWNSSTRFRNITSNILLDILWIGQHRGVDLRQISSIQTKQTLWDNLGCYIKHCLACTWCCYSGRGVGVESMVRSSLVIAEKRRTVIWCLQQRGDIKKKHSRNIESNQLWFAFSAFPLSSRISWLFVHYILSIEVVL